MSAPVTSPHAVRGWTISLALTTVAAWLALLPRPVAAEVVGVRVDRDGAVELRLQAATVPTPGNVAMLLRWHYLLTGSRVEAVPYLPDVRGRRRALLLDVRIVAVVDGVDVVARRLVPVTAAQMDRVREYPGYVLAVLTEVAGGASW